MEECDHKDWSVSNKFGITIPCSATLFREVGARLSLKVAIKASFIGWLWKLRFFGYFGKAKIEEYKQKQLSFFDKFGMLMLGSET